jgi:predicted nucleic acid-binding Zn ribbon protein
MAEDCPVCGEKDAPDSWRGARMGSTSWGHDYMCCSDECGRKYANSRERYQRDLQLFQQQLHSVQGSIAVLNGKIAQAKPLHQSPKEGN